jgi:transcription factor E2F3
VTHDDIRGLPSLRGKTLIAVKAPSGTTLEVPDPDEGMLAGRRRFQIFLRSSGGPIDVYLVSRVDSAQPTVVADQPPPLSPGGASVVAAAAAAAATTAEAMDEGLVRVLPPRSPDMMFFDGQGIADLYPDDSLPLLP